MEMAAKVIRVDNVVVGGVVGTIISAFIALLRFSFSKRIFLSQFKLILSCFGGIRRCGVFFE